MTAEADVGYGQYVNVRKGPDNFLTFIYYKESACLQEAAVS